jgi:hypothetical protein
LVVRALHLLSLRSLLLLLTYPQCPELRVALGCRFCVTLLLLLLLQDAIGAIARCFTFGGARGRVLHDPAVARDVALTKAAYMAADKKTTTINHFYEKLLLIKDMMKTPAGRRVAAERHAFMEQFLAQFYDEWAGLK